MGNNERYVQARKATEEATSDRSDSANSRMLL